MVLLAMSANLSCLLNRNLYSNYACSSSSESKEANVSTLTMEVRSPFRENIGSTKCFDMKPFDLLVRPHQMCNEAEKQDAQNLPSFYYYFITKGPISRESAGGNIPVMVWEIFGGVRIKQQCTLNY